MAFTWRYRYNAPPFYGHAPHVSEAQQRGLYREHPAISTGAGKRGAPSGASRDLVGGLCQNSALTGKCGAVIAGEWEVARVTGWSLEISVSGVKFVSSSARAWSQFLPTTKSGSGKLTFVYYDTNYLWRSEAGGLTPDPEVIYPYTQEALLFPGMTVALSLMIDSRDRSRLGYYIPNAIITGYSIEVDVLSAGVVGGSFSFEASGIKDGRLGLRVDTSEDTRIAVIAPEDATYRLRVPRRTTEALVSQPIEGAFGPIEEG